MINGKITYFKFTNFISNFFRAENDLDCLDPTEGDHDIYEDDEARVFNDKGECLHSVNFISVLTIVSVLTRVEFNTSFMIVHRFSI